MTLSALYKALGKSRRFLEVVVLAIQKWKQSLYHLFRERKRKTEEAIFQVLDSSRLGFEAVLDSIYSESGVGVYQKKLVIFHQMQISDIPHRWVVDTLRNQYLYRVDMDMACALFQTAVLIAHHLRLSQTKKCLRMQDEIKLSKRCFRTIGHEQKTLTNASGDVPELCLALKLLLRELGLPSQESHQCPLARLYSK
jgi:hypothetical protein